MDFVSIDIKTGERTAVTSEEGGVLRGRDIGELLKEANELADSLAAHHRGVIEKRGENSSAHPDASCRVHRETYTNGANRTCDIGDIDYNDSKV
jgi:hypothetical protein